MLVPPPPPPPPPPAEKKKESWICPSLVISFVHYETWIAETDEFSREGEDAETTRRDAMWRIRKFRHTIVLVDLDEFPSIFQKVQHFHSRYQKTTSTLLRINLKGKFIFNHSWPGEGAIYITMVKIFGGILKMLVLCNFLKILMVSDKMIHRVFRTLTTL